MNNNVGMWFEDLVEGETSLFHYFASNKKEVDI